MKYAWLCVVMFVWLGQLNAQTEIDIEVNPLTPYQIGEVTLMREAFFTYTAEVKGIISDHFDNLTTGRNVRILFVMHPDSSIDVSISAKPLLPARERQLLKAKLMNRRIALTRFTDYYFEALVTIEGGSTDPYQIYQPEIPEPLESRMAKFNSLSLTEKRVALKKWIFYEVIPVLIYHETAAKENYQAVRDIGRILLEQRFMTENIDRLTDHNPAYWQAVIETEKGDQLIPFTKVCMLLARGEFDRAIRLLEVIRLFSSRRSVPSLYFEEILEKMASIDHMLNAQMQEPLNLYENGKYKKAEEKYQKLLQALPHSARLHCELFYSRAARLKSDKAIRVLWETSKADILGNDPLYPVQLKATTAAEAYKIARRKQVTTFFQSPDGLKMDLIDYAFVAMEQEYFGLAGQLYWLINLYYTEKEVGNKDMSLYFLYCLDQLGDKRIILAYQGNYREAFDEIRKEMQKKMKKSEVYRSFGKR